MHCHYRPFSATIICSKEVSEVSVSVLSVVSVLFFGNHPINQLVQFVVW